MVRGRFAPSPTGELHLGNLRTALLAWLQVRSAGGVLVMRVEDLDVSRVRPGLRQAQLADLRWLGLDWDEGPDVGGDYGPYLQSQRVEQYDRAFARLQEDGRLFACVCSRRDIAAASSAPHGPADEGPRYTGRCRRVPPAQLNSPAALRFRVEPGVVEFDDQLHGSLAYEPERETGDFVVRRKDGVAAYQLAVVVDDAAMEITHVLRGADLLPSTARQILLYRALGLTEPAWLHVPLMLGPDGQRLSKRHGSVTLTPARQAGVAPEAVVGWLAATCGLAAEGEECTPTDLLDRFSLARIPREPTIVWSLPFGQLTSG